MLRVLRILATTTVILLLYGALAYFISAPGAATKGSVWIEWLKDTLGIIYILLNLLFCALPFLGGTFIAATFGLIDDFIDSMIASLLAIAALSFYLLLHGGTVPLYIVVVYIPFVFIWIASAFAGPFLGFIARSALRRSS